MVRALNDQRKAQGFEIADRIRVTLDADGDLEDAIAEHRDWIAGEVLARELSLGMNGAPDAVELTIDGRTLRAALALA